MDNCSKFFEGMMWYKIHCLILENILNSLDYSIRIWKIRKKVLDKRNDIKYKKYK
jgi:hypothetical protein